MQFVLINLYDMLN